MNRNAKLDSGPNSPEEDDFTYWDKVALTRWGKYVTSIEKRFVCQGIQLSGNPSAGVDVGCGSGQWSKLASDAGWRMTCVDVDPRALSICKRNVPEANCILAEAGSKEIRCQSNSAGLMFCIEVGPVVESDWFISEASRVLNHSGTLVAVVWNRRSWRGFAWRFKNRLQGNRHDCFYNHPYSRWKQNLTEAGFNIVHQEGFSWGPLGRTSDSFLVPLYVRLEQALRLNRLIVWSPWIALIAKKAASKTKSP